MTFCNTNQFFFIYLRKLDNFELNRINMIQSLFIRIKCKQRLNNIVNHTLAFSCCLVNHLPSLDSNINESNSSLGLIFFGLPQEFFVVRRKEVMLRTYKTKGTQLLSGIHSSFVVAVPLSLHQYETGK